MKFHEKGHLYEKFHSVRLQRNFKTIEILFFQEIIEIRMSLDKITYKFGSIFTNTSDEKTKFTISIPNSNEDDLFEVFQWIRKLTLLGL